MLLVLKICHFESLIYLGLPQSHWGARAARRSFLVLCFSLWGLSSGLARSSPQAPFLCILLVLFIHSGAVDGCSGACVAARGRGKMWVRLEAAPFCPGICGLTSFSSSPPLLLLRGRLLGRLLWSCWAVCGWGLPGTQNDYVTFQEHFPPRQSHGPALSFGRHLWQILV